jgi:hypothetical protein
MLMVFFLKTLTSFTVFSLLEKNIILCLILRNGGTTTQKSTCCKKKNKLFILIVYICCNMKKDFLKKLEGNSNVNTETFCIEKYQNHYKNVTM